MTSIDVAAAANNEPDETVAALLSAPEDQWFERKSGRIDARDLARPLVAMANAEGGVVAVGLHNGKIDPVPASKVNELRQVAFDFTTPPVRIKVTELETTEGLVMAFEVSPGESVHETTSGECFLRVGDESRKLKYAERRELDYDRGTIPFDGTPSPEQEISGEKLAKYRDLIGSSTNEKALLARNLKTTQNELTVAGYLLFSEHPQAVYPNAYVRVLKYAGTERGTGSRQTLEAGSDIAIEGSLPDQIKHASREIERLMPVRRALGSSGTFEDIPLVPKAAWLEGLVNAVTHRSYAAVGDHTRVEIFTNRIEITSPGRFPGIVDLTNPLSIHRHARNPRIARVLADLGLTQELGEGIKRIFEEMSRIGLTDPSYIQGINSVKLTLMGSDALPSSTLDQLPKNARLILDNLRLESRALGTGEIAEMTKLARPTVIRHLQRLREMSLVAWEGNSPTDPRASWKIA